MNMEILKDKMDIGLFNLEPKIHNSAMMQVAQYWREREGVMYGNIIPCLIMIKFMHFLSLISQISLLLRKI